MHFLSWQTKVKQPPRHQQLGSGCFLVNFVLLSIGTCRRSYLPASRHVASTPSHHAELSLYIGLLPKTRVFYNVSHNPPSWCWCRILSLGWDKSCNGLEINRELCQTPLVYLLKRLGFDVTLGGLGVNRGLVEEDGAVFFCNRNQKSSFKQERETRKPVE